MTYTYGQIVSRQFMQDLVRKAGSCFSELTSTLTMKPAAISSVTMLFKIIFRDPAIPVQDIILQPLPESFNPVGLLIGIGIIIRVISVTLR